MSIRTDVLFDIWCLYQSQRLLHIFIFTPIIQMRHERLIHKTEICLWSEYGWCFLQQIELLKTGKRSIHKWRNEYIDKRSINTARAVCALFELVFTVTTWSLAVLHKAKETRRGDAQGQRGGGNVWNYCSQVINSVFIFQFGWLKRTWSILGHVLHQEMQIVNFI